jgi:hypothetical protein
MARGKYSDLAVRRRLDGALAHIDDLTEQLASEKIRRRQAEERAARFEGVDQMNRSMELRNDEMLADALGKLRWWDHVVDEDVERRKAALRELGEKFFFDCKLDGLLTNQERVEYLEDRYPRLMAALRAGTVVRNRGFLERSPYRPALRKLDDPKRERFERLVGLRHSLNADDDRGLNWADVMEAQQAGFSVQEALEYVTGEERPFHASKTARAKLA